MAAIDFPASPSIGQAFTAGNGVTYTWNGLLWVASGASAGGDVYAKNSTGFGIGTTETVVSFNTIVTGNSGGWYNTSNGRFTPPAGRYFIRVQMTGSQSGITTIYSIIRKNGVAIVSAPATTGGASHSMEPAVDGIFDANGTDYFEAACQASASAVSVNGFFVAFPIGGIKGPPGDPGQLGFRLLQRTDVSSAVPAVTIQGIASDVNDLMFTFDLTPVTNADTLALQFYDNTGALATTSYIGSLQQTYDLIADGGAPSAFGQTTAGAVSNSIILSVLAATARVNNVTGIRGTGTIPNIRAARPHSCNFQCNYVNDTLGSLRIIQGGGWRNVATAITGLRLTFNSNIASGAFSVWGSP